MPGGIAEWTTTCAAEDPVWTAARLRACLKTAFGGSRVIVLANREPFRHDRGPRGEPIAARSAGGLVTALEPVLRACRGVWVAHGSGAADRCVVDDRDGLGVPPERPAYRLRRVWLDAHEQRHYYDGFANEGLWPLCHRVAVNPVFRADDFVTYGRVNEKFAAVVAEEADDAAPVVLVQDYHFALAPRMIRRRLPRGTIIAFWHIPFPAPGELDRCPWQRDLLRGLLGSTVLGFHTAADCRHFFDAAARLPGAVVDRRRDVVCYAGRETIVRAYPISIAWPNSRARQARGVDACRRLVRRRLGVAPSAQLIVGVDRLDYTKGLCEKALAFERLLEARPDARGRVTFVQIAEPSREHLAAYRALRARLVATVDRINARFGAAGYHPIVLREARHEPAEVHELFRAADVCYVGSLHDGMNLVAKEFVAARDDERGVLVLSRNAGAAAQLTAALVVNPYDAGESARALARALAMPDAEQAMRMRVMRANVAEFNSYWWAGRMIQDAALRLPRKLIRMVGEERVDAERVQKVLHLVAH
jgi:trehalose 6-phosphate synthase